jgi:uncharacterized alkaline shock family protein YloU
MTFKSQDEQGIGSPGKSCLPYQVHFSLEVKWRMHIVNRVLMIIVALVIFIFGLITFLLLTGVVAPISQPLRDVLALYTALRAIALLRGIENNVAIIIALLLTLIGLGLLILECWGPVQRLLGRGQLKRYVVRQDSTGQVTVDSAMVRNWVQHEAESVPGVVHADPEVKDGKDGLHVSTRAAIAWDAEAPEVGEVLQQRIKDAVQTHLGLPVAEVCVRAQSAPLVKEPPRRRVA